MDEVLETVEVIADSGLEGVVTWTVRLVGLVVLLAGVGLWLLTDVGALVPAVVIVAGVVLLIAPGVLLAAAELAG